MPPEHRLEVQGLFTSASQKFLTIAGTVAVITSVLTGAAVGLLAAVISSHSAALAFSAGGTTAIATLTLMVRYLAAQMTRPLPPAGVQTPSQTHPKE